MSLAERPVYCQTTLTTGMLMAGKISVGVRNSTNGVRSSSSNEATTKVYGRRRASRTIHITSSLVECQREVHRIQKRLIAAWFAQEVHRAKVQRLQAGFLVPMGGDKDRGEWRLDSRKQTL